MLSKRDNTQAEQIEDGLDLQCLLSILTLRDTGRVSYVQHKIMRDAKDDYSN